MKAKETDMLKQASRFWVAVIASALIVSISSTARAQGNHVSRQQLKEQLTKTIAKVRTGESSNARTEAAEHLADLTRGIDPKLVDKGTIADLASLLDVSEDSVRGWVADCLGNLGPRAKMAVPKLLKILPEVECLNVSMSSDGDIRFALKRMGVTPPPPPKCGTTRD